MNPKPQANTLDEILESFGEDVADQYGGDSGMYGLVGLETAKQQIQAHYLAEVLDMIGEDAVSIPSNGDDGLDNQCQTCEYLLEWDGYDIDCRCKDQNKLRDELRKAAKERFK